ncbi:MAG: M15 family metallopeptidase [Alphaproteobacteria bacterium]
MQDKTILKEVNHERFIIDLMYNSINNSFYKNLYEPFGLNKCYVLPDLYDKLMKLIPVLEKEKLKLVIYDTLRPWKVQKYMYETAPDYLKPYIAPPPEETSKRGFHPRGAAIDCYLADENGKSLDFPTHPDAFYAGYEKDNNYQEYLKKVHRCCIDGLSQEQINNRQKLEDMMLNIGLEPLETEWWHFNLPEAWNYPLIYSLDEIEIK